MRHPVTIAVLAVIAIAVGLLQSNASEAQATDGLFQVQAAHTGTLLAGADHQCGAGSCGSEDKGDKADHQCGAGSCGSKDGSDKGDHQCGAGSCGSKS